MVVWWLWEPLEVRGEEFVELVEVGIRVRIATGQSKASESNVDALAVVQGCFREGGTTQFERVIFILSTAFFPSGQSAVIKPERVVVEWKRMMVVVHTSIPHSNISLSSWFSNYSFFTF